MPMVAAGMRAMLSASSAPCVPAITASRAGGNGTISCGDGMGVGISKTKILYNNFNHFTTSRCSEARIVPLRASTMCLPMTGFHFIRKSGPFAVPTFLPSTYQSTDWISGEAWAEKMMSSCASGMRGSKR